MENGTSSKVQNLFLFQQWPRAQSHLTGLNRILAWTLYQNLEMNWITDCESGLITKHTNASVAEWERILAAMFQHLVETLKPQERRLLQQWMPMGLKSHIQLFHMGGMFLCPHTYGHVLYYYSDCCRHWQNGDVGCDSDVWNKAKDMSKWAYMALTICFTVTRWTEALHMNSFLMVTSWRV